MPLTWSQATLGTPSAQRDLQDCLILSSLGARHKPGPKETFNDHSGEVRDAAPVFENGEAEALGLGPLTLVLSLAL